MHLKKFVFPIANILCTLNAFYYENKIEQIDNFFIISTPLLLNDFNSKRLPSQNNLHESAKTMLQNVLDCLSLNICQTPPHVPNK